MSQSQSAKRKVLIADDDDDARMMLTFLIESEGWEIVEACNGKEALEKVINEQPHVLLIDNRMPELTGAEVCQHIRQKGIAVSIILMTAYADGRQLAASLGLSYFLSKPLDLPELLATLESAYEKY